MKNVIFVRVGSDERPAGEEDVKDMTTKFEALKEKNDSLKGYDIFVTHHAVDVVVINEDGLVSTITY